MYRLIQGSTWKRETLPQIPWHRNNPSSPNERAAARSLGEDGLFLCQGICGNVSRVHTDPWIKRYIFPNSMLPSVAQLTRAAEGVFIVEDVKNIGPNYDPTLLAWEENFSRAWPRFADRYGERFRRMWRFYLLSSAGAFRARSLQVFSILFSKEDTAIESDVRDQTQAACSSRTPVPEPSPPLLSSREISKRLLSMAAVVGEKFLRYDPFLPSSLR